MHFFNQDSKFLSAIPEKKSSAGTAHTHVPYKHRNSHSLFDTQLSPSFLVDVPFFTKKKRIIHLVRQLFN